LAYSKMKIYRQTSENEIANEVMKQKKN